MRFLNVMMEHKAVPATMLTAVVAPLHKNKREPSSLTNIRPISLMEVLAKIMDKHYSIQIQTALRKHPNIISDTQNAFCPGRGVTTPLLCNELVNEDAARSNGDRAAWTAYHDVSKAYDSVEFWAQEVALRRLKLPEHFIGYMKEVTRRGTSRAQTAYGLTDAI